MVNGSSASAITAVRGRQISEADIDAIADLLTRGFAGRPRQYWKRGLERQATRPVVPGCPRLGYMLESDGKAVGAVLVLCSSFETGDQRTTRCNLSSWYVDPAYRAHASLLTLLAMKHKGVTYTNISPARPTWPTVEAQGFTRYCSGQFFSMPLLSLRMPGVRVEVVRPDDTRAEITALPEFELLIGHAEYGCLSLVCFAPDATAHPFILLPFRIRKGRVPLPCMHLIYCRDIADFVAFANPVGRMLLRRAKSCVILDAVGPVPGLVGMYREARGRKYFKGPVAPRLGDLAYTEFVVFGP